MSENLRGLLGGLSQQNNLGHTLRIFFFIIVIASLSGCVTRTWETSYNDLVARSASNDWYSADIRVIVPARLTVSDANLFAPRADIVWRGDPKGDRYQQVTQIVEQAAKNAAKALNGRRPVRLEIEVEQFHALSDRARLVAPSAVHNLKFKLRIFDVRTGKQIIPTDRIRADFPAYTRSQALEAERLGYTQKVRITKHLEDVIKGWLRQGPDPRGTFKALGR